MRILGIEFGTWSLKAVEMESRFRRLDVLDFHEIRLPLEILDPTETYRRAVTQLMARLPSHPEKIVTSLPPAQTALRFLPIPLKQRKKVEKTFRFELEDTVPFKLENAIVEHYVMPKKDGSVVFAAIAPEKHVQSHVEWLRSIGVDPDWLTFEGMGLINLYLTSLADSKVPPPSEPLLLLDIGHHKTNLSIFEENRLELFRSISWGGAAVTQSLSATLGLALEEAERYKMNDLKMDMEAEGGSADSQELVAAATHAFGPFLADINHSLVAFRTLYQKRIQSVLITGGTSKIWGIESFLNRRLDVPVESFHAFEKLNLKAELRTADEARFGEPLGRAMVFARKAPLLFNFRAQAAAKGNSLGEVRNLFANPNALLLCTFVGILVGLLSLHSCVASRIADNEVKRAQGELQKEFGETFRSVPTGLRKTLVTDPDALKKYIDQKTNELEQKLKVFAKERVPMMTLVRAISESFPPDVKVDVNTLSLDDRTFVMEGVLYEGDLNKVTDLIQKVPSLTKVNLTRDGQRFTFRGEVVGR